MNPFFDHQAVAPKGGKLPYITDALYKYDDKCRILIDKLQTKTLLSVPQLIKQAGEYVQRNVSAHGRYLTDLEMMRDAFHIMLVGSDRDNLSVGEMASDYLENSIKLGEKVDCSWGKYWGWYCYEIGGPDDEETEAYSDNR